MDKYNTFWRRFFALIIDGIMIAAVTGLSTRFLSTDNEIIWKFVSYINTFLPYVYAIFMIANYEQTIGKMAMKIKVVDNSTEKKIGYPQAFKREVVPLFLVVFSMTTSAILLSGIDWANFELSTLSWILLFIPSSMSLVWSILEIVTMLFDAKNRALHDKISDTVVVKTYE